MMRTVARAATALAVTITGASLFVILRHIGLLLEAVTVGPVQVPMVGNTQGMLLYRLLDSIGLAAFVTSDAARLAGITLVIAAVVLSRKIWHSGHDGHTATVVFQTAAALTALACSYRFMGLLAFSGVLVWQVWRRPGALQRWLSFSLGVALCLAPFDISARNFEGKARFETSLHCVGETATEEYLANKRVCVDSDAPIYNEPTRVWVW